MAVSERPDFVFVYKSSKDLDRTLSVKSLRGCIGSQHAGVVGGVLFLGLEFARKEDPLGDCVLDTLGGPCTN